MTGKELYDARIKHKVSAVAAARAAGISVNTLYAWEKTKVISTRKKGALQKLMRFIEGEPPAVSAAPKAKTSSLPSLVRQVSFFLKDQSRRSNLLELLNLSIENGLNIQDLKETME